jgi:hypothetical protein
VQKLSREAIVLMAIGAIDLVLTIFLVRYRDASEGNPLMAYYLKQGVSSFVVAKAILCIVPLFLLEYARRHRPKFVTYCMRGLIAAYLGAYVMGVSQMNDAALVARANAVDLAWVESPVPLFTQEYAKVHHLAHRE